MTHGVKKHNRDCSQKDRQRQQAMISRQESHGSS